MRLAAGRAQLPQRGDKAVGYATDSSGRLLHTGELWSGENGPGEGAPGIRHDGPKPWHRMPVVYHHVEGHTAALVRERARQGKEPDAVLVISEPPCPGRYGCDRILPEILPRGAQLRVFVVGEDGSVTEHRGRPYVGNGLGVN